MWATRISRLWFFNASMAIGIANPLTIWQPWQLRSCLAKSFTFEMGLWHILCNDVFQVRHFLSGIFFSPWSPPVQISGVCTAPCIKVSEAFKLYDEWFIWAQSCQFVFLTSHHCFQTISVDEVWTQQPSTRVQVPKQQGSVLMFFSILKSLISLHLLLGEKSFDVKRHT